MALHAFTNSLVDPVCFNGFPVHQYGPKFYLVTVVTVAFSGEAWSAGLRRSVGDPGTGASGPLVAACSKFAAGLGIAGHGRHSSLPWTWVAGTPRFVPRWVREGADPAGLGEASASSGTARGKR